MDKGAMLRKTLIEGVGKRMQDKIVQECLGVYNSEEKEKKKKMEDLLLARFSQIKEETKDTMIQEDDLGVDEMITKIDLINELFNEIEHTLSDLHTEPLGKKNPITIKEFGVRYQLFKVASNYLGFILKRLGEMRDEIFDLSGGFNHSFLDSDDED